MVTRVLFITPFIPICLSYFKNSNF